MINNAFADFDAMIRLNLLSSLLNDLTATAVESAGRRVKS